MTLFVYTAVNGAGTPTSGSHRSRSIGEVRRWLQDRDQTPISITEKISRWQFEITPAKAKRQVLLHFTRQLSVFVRSGIPLTTALEILHDEAGDSALRRALSSIINDIAEGQSLSDAAARHRQVFPHYYVGLMRNAEQTGHLEASLDSLAMYLQRDLDTRASISSALAYPAIVVVLALITVAVLAGYVLPQFQPLFVELGAELPTPTRVLLGVSRIFTDFIIFPFAATTLLVGFTLWLIKSKRGRRLLDQLALRLPVVRGLVHYLILERFCRILATMVTAGIAIPDGMAAGALTTRNGEMRERLERARSKVESGQGFAGPLSETKLFPAAAIQMFRVGEETGTLENQLTAASEYFDAELAQRIRRFTALFEPAMIIGVGLTVGFVAVALVSAMYGVLDGVKEPLN